MRIPKFSSPQSTRTTTPKRTVHPLWLAAFLLFATPLHTVAGLEPQNPTPPATPPAAPPDQSAPPSTAPAQPANSQDEFSSITEEGLRRQLVGKPLFLRGGYLGDSLSFTEHGDPTGHPAKGSYTLSAVQIDKVRLTKHRIELEGSRYALHFLGALPNEDPSTAVDRIKITPKKKVLKITIDREIVVKTKKVKEAKKPNPQPAAPSAAGQPVASSETDVPATAPKPASPPDTPAAAAQTSKSNKPSEPSAPAAESSPEGPDQPGDQAPADSASQTSTVSPAHAAKVLHDALDKIFTVGLDDKLRAQMPEFWQLYYQAQAARVDYRPKDPKVLRSSAVDQQAKLLSVISPDSNEFAQANGIVGQALYRVVVGADGVPGTIAVERPIGFGLDENAVAAIRKATFQPAVKDGQPVAETLDLAVLFRIYSKRTSVAAGDQQSAQPAKPAEAVKPGPYSVKPKQP